MINKVYDEILRMILKQTQNVSGDGYSNITYNNLIPTLTDEGEDPNNPKPDNPTVYDTVNKENYNYKLEYNEDEELIGFTSNNGEWHWILNNDSYGDLVSILVTNPFKDFLIALIWRNYDIRKNDTETDEKGLLTEVVLLNPDGTSLFKGLTIEPSFKSISPNETAQFNAYLVLPNGEKVLSTDLVEWNIINPGEGMSITQDGVIVNPITGTWTISAFYNGTESTATLEVRSIDLKISPDRQVVNPGTNITFKVTDVSNITNNIIDNKDCEWNVICEDVTIPLPTIENGHLTNLGNYNATYTVICSFRSNTIQATVKVITPQLLIDPNRIEIYMGQTAQFNAYLKRASEYTQVNRQCSWTIDNPNIQISKGLVTDTNIAGIFNIGATYESLGVSGTGVLVIKNSKLSIEPTKKTLNINSSFSFHAYYINNLGNKQLVDTSCVWSIESPCAVNNGNVITGNDEGSYNLTATYEGITVYSQVTVMNPYVEITPSLQEINPNQSCVFKAYYHDCDGTKDITDVGIWQVNSINALINNGRFFNCNVPGSYTVGITYVQDKQVFKAESLVTVVANNINIEMEDKLYYLGDSIKLSALLDNQDVSANCTWYLNDVAISYNGSITPIASGTNTLRVEYNGKSITKSIDIIDRQLIILPNSASVTVGQYQSFKAYLRSTNVSDIDVTSNCTWRSDEPLRVNNNGKVTNTDESGSYKVTANYNKLHSMEATASLVVSRKSFNVHTKKLKLSFRDSDTVDGDYITVWLNDEVLLDNIRLELAWQSVEVELNDGVNILKVGANCNGLDLYNNTSYGPSFSAGKVTASFKATSLDNISVITENIFNIDVPETGASRINLDPNQYYEVSAITLT